MQKPMLGLIIFLFLTIACHSICKAQSKEPFCGRKWYCESTKDIDGNIHVPEKGEENDYMLFLCDSNFLLIEDSTTLKGKWCFDEETAIITLTQSQITSLPDKFSYHFMEYDEAHLVMIGEEGTHGQTIAYFITK